MRLQSLPDAVGDLVGGEAVLPQHILGLAGLAEAILHEADRGVTLIDSQGWYTKERSKVVMVVCRKRETATILKFVKTIDPEAFMTVGSVMGVYGKGFQTIGKG